MRNKERTDLEATRRPSLIDEETRKMRAQEVGAGASSFRRETSDRITTDGEDIVVGTTKGGPSTDVVGYRELDPPTC